MRRLISAAAGVAVAAAGVVVIPMLLQGHTVSPAAPLHYKVTVEPVGQNAPHGLIGQGVTDGKPWKVTASGPPSSPTMTSGTFVAMGITAAGVPGAPASLATVAGPSRGDVIVTGTVGRNVTSIAITLPDGELLSLKPVRWTRYRWVAVVIPARVRIVRAVAYAGSTELGYAVPFGNSELTSWWRPGQAGPARLTRSIGAGVVDRIAWYYTADLGPWGYCYLQQGGRVCMDSTADPAHVPAGQLISHIGCAEQTATSPTSGFGAAAPDVLKVVLKYSDGSTGAFTTVAVGKDRMFGYSIPGRLHVARSLEYGQAGHLVGSTTSGDGWECPPGPGVLG